MPRNPEHPPHPTLTAWAGWVRAGGLIMPFTEIRADETDTVEVIRLLDQWAAYNRGWHGPRGAPRMAIEYSAVFGPQGQEPEWPADVYRTENALTALGLTDKRKLKVIKWRWLANYSYREIERKLRIRNGDGREFVNTSIRALSDIMFEMGTSI